MLGDALEGLTTDLGLEPARSWPRAEAAPLAVLIITLNERHNLTAFLDNLEGFADEVFMLDSFSNDGSVEYARSRGVVVTQHEFDGFGAQWNRALACFPVSAPFSMKLDPDERLDADAKASIREALQAADDSVGFVLERRLWFMGRVMPVKQEVLRIWRTGSCRFTDVTVNEHPLVPPPIYRLKGLIEHHDSPDLEHWLDKQNKYTTAEAVRAFGDAGFAVEPRLLGTALQRRMWLKRIYPRIPLRHALMFLYLYLWRGAWRAGAPGLIWSRLRVFVFRMREYKLKEMELRRAAAARADPP